jgi:hypothetical protein
VSMTCWLKIQHFLVNGYSGFLPRMVYGRIYYEENMWAQKRCPKFIGNQGTHTSGWV